MAETTKCTWCDCWICNDLPVPPPGFIYRRAGSDELVRDPNVDFYSTLDGKVWDEFPEAR